MVNEWNDEIFEYRWCMKSGQVDMDIFRNFIGFSPCFFGIQDGNPWRGVTKRGIIIFLLYYYSNIVYNMYIIYNINFSVWFWKSRKCPCPLVHFDSPLMGGCKFGKNKGAKKCCFPLNYLQIPWNFRTFALSNERWEGAPKADKICVQACENLRPAQVVKIFTRRKAKQENNQKPENKEKKQQTKTLTIKKRKEQNYGIESKSSWEEH